MPTNKEIQQSIPSQLPNEPEREYVLFRQYCLLGYNRNLSAVADKITKLECSASNKNEVSQYRQAILSKVQKASSKYRWNHRVQQYDTAHWARVTYALADCQEKLDQEWLKKAELTRVAMHHAIADALELQKATGLLVKKIQEILQDGDRVTKTSEIERLSSIVRNCGAATKQTLETITAAWDVKGHTDTIIASQSWQQQAMEFLNKSNAKL